MAMILVYCVCGTIKRTKGSGKGRQNWIDEEKKKKNKFCVFFFEGGLLFEIERKRRTVCSFLRMMLYWQ